MRVRMASVVAVHAAGRSRRARRRRRHPVRRARRLGRRLTHHFDVPGVVEHAFGLKQLDDALAIRTHVLDQFERAAVDPSLVADGGLDVVVCGGGPTGVEMAGGLRELYTKVLARTSRSCRWRRPASRSSSMADRLLTPFTPQSSQRALQTLRRRGVDVRLGVGVAKVESDRRRPDRRDDHPRPHHDLGHRRDRRTAGPHDRQRRRTRGGRLVVEPDLTLPGHPEIFAIGDIAAAPDDDGRAASPGRPAGDPGGKHVARQLRAPPRRRAHRAVPCTATRGRWRRSAATTP